ncbi:hypothetical protein G9A89_007505 [Geosiphon pyriformis]|nr:hypothetical protein G9A89_007505 [Geosiphon pyriformis]
MTTLPTEIHRLFEDLNRRQLELETSVTSLKHVCDLFKQQELAAYIRLGMRELEKQLEHLKQTAEEQDRDKDIQAILQRLERNQEQFKQLQGSIRQAILISNQNIEKEAKLQLLEISEGRKGEAYELRRRNLTSDDAVLRATDDVTKTLQRTVQLMQQEIERSAYSAKSLEDSSRTLKTTYKEFHGFTAVVRGSKQLITKLEQSDWTDSATILTSKCFDMATITKNATSYTGNVFLD